jgi:hypothetical protein
VFSVIVLAPETTFYLVFFCTVLLLMGEFYVDDKYTFKKELKLRDQGYFLCFLFCVVENGASDGAGQWCETTRGIEFSKLHILFVVYRVAGICCVGSVLFEEMDIGMNAREMQQHFLDSKNSTALELGTECWSSVGF